MHAFGPVDRYAPAPTRGYDPPVTSLAGYRAQAHSAGIGHSVFVQASIYGDDNAATLDAMDAGQGAHRGVNAAGADRGVIVAGGHLSASDLPGLHARGVRGLRLNLQHPNPIALARIQALMPALQDLGWHVCALLDTTAPGVLDDLLARIPVPLVVDHFGRPPLDTTDKRAFRPLLDAVGSGRVWVKLSAPYQITTGSYDRLAPIARALHWARPEATLFASNWPHVGAPDPDAVPDIADLIGIAADWLDLSRDRAITLFAGNAAALYA